MAFVRQNIDEDEQNKFAPTGETTPQPATTGGSSGAGDTSQPSAVGVGTSTEFGTNASKLSDYLSANSGQIEAQGNQMAGDLSKQFGQIQGDINQGVQDFGKSVGSGYTPFDQNLVENAATDPTAITKDPSKLQQFQGIYNDQYKGPNAFEQTDPYAQINDKVSKAVDNASLLNSPAGWETFMSNQERPDSTGGMRTLDASLIRGNPNAQKAVLDAAKPFAGLTDYLGQKSGEANKSVGAAKTAADQARQQAQARFTGPGGAISSFQGDLDKRVDDARGNAKKTSDLLTSLVQNRQSLTPEQAQQLGMTQADWNKLNESANWLNKDWKQSFDFNPYLQQAAPDVAIGRGNVASADDYAKEAAYEQLTGNPLSILQNDQSGQAGTAPTSLSQFLGSKAGTDVNSMLLGRDKQMIDAFGGGAPGVPGMSPSTPAASPFLDPADSNFQNFYKQAYDVYNRNPDLLNQTGKDWLSTYGPYLTGSVPMNPASGTTNPITGSPIGTVPTNPVTPGTATPPSTDPNAPPAAGAATTRVDPSGSGLQVWNGTAWMAAPKDNRPTGFGTNIPGVF